MSLSNYSDLFINIIFLNEKEKKLLIYNNEKYEPYELKEDDVNLINTLYDEFAKTIGKDEILYSELIKILRNNNKYITKLFKILKDFISIPFYINYKKNVRQKKK